MSIDEFMQFALDVVKKKNSSMEEFQTRFVEVKKEWIENHKGNSKLFDDEEEQEEQEQEEQEEQEASADVDVDAVADAFAEDDIEDSRLFFTMYGDATYSVLRSRYNIDYVKAVKALMKRQQEAYIEGLKQELQKKIAEREFDIKQIDVEIQNAKLDNTLPEQLEVLMEEKKELQNSLYQMKKDLRSGNYTNSL